MKLSSLGVGTVAVAIFVSSATWVGAEKRATEPYTGMPVEITAPEGTYELDPNHASLIFRVNHLGLSNYVARFARITARLKLDPSNPAASSVAVTIDPSSVRTDYPSDYRGAHPQSHYQSWDEELGSDSNFFNAGKFAQIAFRSKRVELTGPSTARVIGDLTFLGQTHPVTLEAVLVGSTGTHPLSGGGAVGLSVKGSFKRSDFGMTYLLLPPIVGDAVAIEFNGEFLQKGAQQTGLTR